MYLFLGIPNRSHVLNSGDQLVNVTLRSQIRQRSKFRLLRHCMAIKEGRVPPGTALDMSEQTVKPLLALWVTEWVNDPSRKSWVEDSWRKVLELAPEITSVDDVPPPAPVIYLPPTYAAYPSEWSWDE